MKLTFARLMILCTGASYLCMGQNYVNSQLPWHDVVLDGNGKLLAWYNAGRNQGYDKVLRLGWDFLEHQVPKDTRHGTGLKIYLINSVFDATTLQGANWQGNPASTFGQFVDAVVGWYAYSGDEESIRVVHEMLDHQLEHGTTPADWEWAGVPFATNCDDQVEYGRCLRGVPKEFYGGIETDKVGELGIGYALFYELTGERKYLDAAIRCGEALAKHIRAGDAEHTPWPFRVYAKTGEVLNGEEYGGMIVAPVRLFSELIRLNTGNAAKYLASRDLAWKWVLEYPLNSGSRAWNKWSGYFEDVPKDTDNVNQASPTMAAFYILSSPDPAVVDRQWSSHVGHMIDWVRQRFGRGPYFGAWAIDEQGTPDGRGCCSRAGLASDTSRWGAINALYCEKTGDSQAREDAFRSLNYATYFAASDGKIACCGLDYADSYWFDDGYADHIRNYLWAMGAVPTFAPSGENHLLRSSSVVTKIAYQTHKIVYRTFAGDATEAFRINFKPAYVTAGGTELSEHSDLRGPGYTLQSLPGGDYVLRIRHGDARDVEVF